jgi:hypothetical protein
LLRGKLAEKISFVNIRAIDTDEKLDRKSFLHSLREASSSFITAIDRNN